MMNGYNVRYAVKGLRNKVKQICIVKNAEEKKNQKDTDDIIAKDNHNLNFL